MSHGGAELNGMTACNNFSLKINTDHAGPAPAIPRLGIKPYQWGTECLSGDVNAGPATSFPQAIGMVMLPY